MDVSIGTGADVPPDGTVGTITPSPVESYCAIAAELPRHKDKLRLPKDISRSSFDDINHPPVEIGRELIV
ncbi:hypothetical protein ANSO36C_13080 [Nostoc cf. commune SO-36]|uniref:Uncharacterized protein n=1 Tax=Nostoc cf. commune SO-36 TaxID=449208 RepID=A0ABN6PZT3_NOSCO|nr:hypothetical protein ANSO36C_13080 [Nostoc cf. commune SO-36]